MEETNESGRIKGRTCEDRYGRIARAREGQENERNRKRKRERERERERDVVVVGGNGL